MRIRALRAPRQADVGSKTRSAGRASTPVMPCMVQTGREFGTYLLQTRPRTAEAGSMPTASSAACLTGWQGAQPQIGEPVVDMVITGRHIEVPTRLRAYAEEKLAKVEKLRPKAIRVDVELARERNPRLAE